MERATRLDLDKIGSMDFTLFLPPLQQALVLLAYST